MMRWRNRGRGDARFAFRFTIHSVGPLPPNSAGNSVCVTWVRGGAKKGATKKAIVPAGGGVVRFEGADVFNISTMLTSSPGGFTRKSLHLSLLEDLGGRVSECARVHVDLGSYAAQARVWSESGATPTAPTPRDWPLKCKRPGMAMTLSLTVEAAEIGPSGVPKWPTPAPRPGGPLARRGSVSAAIASREAEARDRAAAATASAPLDVSQLSNEEAAAAATAAALAREKKGAKQSDDPSNNNSNSVNDNNNSNNNNNYKGKGKRYAGTEGYEDEEDHHTHTATASQYLSSDEGDFAETVFGDVDEDGNVAERSGTLETTVTGSRLSELSAHSRRSLSDVNVGGGGARTVGRVRSDSVAVVAATASEIGGVNNTTRPGHHRRRSSAAAPNGARPSWSVRTPPRSRSPSPATVTPTHVHGAPNVPSDATADEEGCDADSAVSGSGSVVHFGNRKSPSQHANGNARLNGNTNNVTPVAGAGVPPSSSTLTQQPVSIKGNVSVLLLGTVLAGPPATDDEGRCVSACVVYRCLEKWRAWDQPSALDGLCDRDAGGGINNSNNASAAVVDAPDGKKKGVSPSTTGRGPLCLVLSAYESLATLCAGSLTHTLGVFLDLTTLRYLLHSEVERLRGGLEIPTPHVVRAAFGTGFANGGSPDRTGLHDLGGRLRASQGISRAHLGIRRLETALSALRASVLANAVRLITGTASPAKNSGSPSSTPTLNAVATSTVSTGAAAGASTSSFSSTASIPAEVMGLVSPSGPGLGPLLSHVERMYRCVLDTRGGRCPRLCGRVLFESMRVYDALVFNALMTCTEKGVMTMSNALRVKSALAQFEEWAVRHGAESGSHSNGNVNGNNIAGGGHRKNSASNGSGSPRPASHPELLRHAKQCVDVLIVGKHHVTSDTLADWSKEVCPSLSMAQLQHILTKCEPDEFDSEALPQQVLHAVAQANAQVTGLGRTLLLDAAVDVDCSEIEADIDLAEITEVRVPPQLEGEGGAFAFLTEGPTPL